MPVTYKVRCSSLGTLLSGCGKVTNKYEWKDLDKINDTHKKLAIQIFNSHHGFISPEINSLDMAAGTEHEPKAIMMYDECYNTNYYSFYKDARDKKGSKPFERSNDYLTGTRDFGDTISTFDCKVSTDKNVFDMKKFEAIETDYVLQLNGYRLLYETNNLFLFNALMPPTEEQINKIISKKVYFSNLNLEQEFIYREIIEANYDYDFIPLKKRIQLKEVEIIENFEEIIYKRVNVLNNWIKDNLQ